MSALKCRPGDLAFIASMHPASGLNGRVVRLKNQPPIIRSGFACWELEDRINARAQVSCRTMSGRVYAEGDMLVVDCVADHVLTPIRLPGADAVDQMVKLVGPAPMTAAEAIAWGQA